ncbi:hypothetical protein [Halomonas mongoliensis]|uniref:hypothetical protein n=1 Tax=Halomonas mongoliensis TaxID=321265 RepID=UPI00403B15A3
MTEQQQQHMDRYRDAERIYLEIRQELEEASTQMARLEDQRESTLASSEEAGQRWKEVFRQSLGEAGKEVRELQHQEATLADEADQLEILIKELASHVEQLKFRTAAARKQYQQTQAAARAALVEGELESSAAAMLSTDQGARFLAALAAKKKGATTDVLEDFAFMGAIGFDAHEPSRPGFMAVITGTDRQQIQEEATRRMNARLASIMATHMDRAAQPSAALEELAAMPPALACEK